VRGQRGEKNIKQRRHRVWPRLRFQRHYGNRSEAHSVRGFDQPAGLLRLRSPRLTCSERLCGCCFYAITSWTYSLRLRSSRARRNSVIILSSRRLAAWSDMPPIITGQATRFLSRRTGVRHEVRDEVEQHLSRHYLPQINAMPHRSTGRGSSLQSYGFCLQSRIR
jgi:hypothetical protein